jgi:hypothetical protein
MATTSTDTVTIVSRRWVAAATANGMHGSVAHHARWQSMVQ